MYNPDNRRNSSLGNPLLESFNNYRNTNSKYTPDTAKKLVAKNILKTGIPSKKDWALGKERQDSKKQIPLQ